MMLAGSYYCFYFSYFSLLSLKIVKHYQMKSLKNNLYYYAHKGF